MVVYVCDGCGKRQIVAATRGGDFLKPRDWYQRTDEDGTQTACFSTPAQFYFDIEASTEDEARAMAETLLRHSGLFAEGATVSRSVDDGFGRHARLYIGTTVQNSEGVREVQFPLDLEDETELEDDEDDEEEEASAEQIEKWRQLGSPVIGPQ